MHYRSFGKTNKKVSMLGFGCMRLPVIENQSSKIDETLAKDMIRFAIEKGVNYFDTAYPYHGESMKEGGESEPFLGKVLEGGYREKVYIATKMPCWLIREHEDMDKYLDEQLERLKTNHIDFYLAHSLNKATWKMICEAGFPEFLEKAKKDGRIKHAGFSFHDELSLFKEIVDYYDWDFCQIQYNYMDEYFQAGKEGLKYASEKGLGVVVMEPLRGGKIVNNIPVEVDKVFKNAQRKMNSVEWALRWVWNNPEVSLLLSGMTSMAHVQENVSIAETAEDIVFDEKDYAVVSMAKKAFRDRIRVNCTACGYCMPCPVKVNIPGCFSHYNDFYMYGDPEKNDPKRSGYYSMIGPKQRASNCIKCGKCEEHCPQNIAIREELDKVKELFEPEKVV